MSKMMSRSEYHDWIERKRIQNKAPTSDNGLERANYMIKRTMEMFNMVKTVVNRSDQELKEAMFKAFTPDEKGCLEWVKGQRFRERYVNASPRSKDSFLRIGRLGKEYFGEELVRKCWHHKEPERKVPIQEQIFKAKEIERMSHDTYLEQLRQAKAIEENL